LLTSRTPKSSRLKRIFDRMVPFIWPVSPIWRLTIQMTTATARYPFRNNTTNRYQDPN